MSARYLQRGIGMSGLLVLIALLAFFGTLVVKLGPVYARYLTVASIMEDVAAEPGLAEGGKKAIVDRLRNQLYVNDVTVVDPKAFAVDKVGSSDFAVALAYEERQHLFFNVDAVLSFENEVTVRGR